MSLINVKSETDLSGFYIEFKGSVQNEKKGWYGLSHLMEHLVCHHFDDMLDDFDRDGISWNAYTSDKKIVFYFIGLDEYLKKYKTIILDKMLEFSITEEQFENERKIVLEEYKDYFNKQNHSHILNLERKKFNSYGPIGLRKDLMSMTFSDVKEFFELQFTKPNKIVNVSKYSDFETNIKFDDKKFNNEIIQGDYDIELEKYNSRNGKTSIIILSPTIKEDYAYVNFITVMLGGGLKSPLYQEIREKRGLVYYVRCTLDVYTDNSAIINISSETSDENVEEFQKIILEIFNNPNKHMTEERFDIVKKSLEISLKKQKINRHNNVDKYLENKEFLIEEILDDLTYAEIMSYYHKHFNFSNFTTSIDTIDFK